MTKMLFIGNVPLDGEQALREYLRQFGPHRRLKTARGTTAPWAILYTATYDAAEKILASPDPIIAGTARVRITAANPVPETQIVLTSVPYESTDEDLYWLCQPYGPIEQVRKARTDDGRTGTWFIAYETAAQAVAALEGLNGRQVGDRTICARQYEEERGRDKS